MHFLFFGLHLYFVFWDHVVPLSTICITQTAIITGQIHLRQEFIQGVYQIEDPRKLFVQEPGTDPSEIMSQGSKWQDNRVSFRRQFASK